ncbi:hypothetical protein O157vBn_00079 [Escherichia phage vB_Eco4M-7n]
MNTQGRITNQRRALQVLIHYLSRLYPTAHEQNPAPGNLFKRRNLSLKTFALIQHDRYLDGRYCGPKDSL